MNTKENKKTIKPKISKLTAVGITRLTKKRLNGFIRDFNSREVGVRLIESYVISEAVEKYLDEQGVPK